MTLRNGIRHRVLYIKAKSGHWEITNSTIDIQRIHFGVTSQIDGDLITYDLVIGKHRWVYVRDWCASPNSSEGAP